MEKVYIDDVSWEPIANAYPPSLAICVSPSDTYENFPVVMGIKFKWSSGGGNPTGYNFYLGTNLAGNNIINGRDLNQMFMSIRSLYKLKSDLVIFNKGLFGLFLLTIQGLASIFIKVSISKICPII